MLKKIKEAIKSQSPNAPTKLKERMDRASHAYFSSPGQPVWMERTYEEFAKSAYTKNVIAHRAINMIASAAASIPFKLFRQMGDDLHPLNVHPLLSLLQHPNPMQSTKDFMECLYIYKQLSGNAYILSIGLDSETNPSELYCLRPDRVQVLAGQNFIPTGYRYHVDSHYIDYMVNQTTDKCPLLHIKNFHPLNEHYGLSSIEAAAYSIDQHNQASAWNQALLQNGARPSGALVVKNSEGKPTVLGAVERQNLRESIESAFSGADNAGRPLLLEGGLEWQEMSLSPKDMDYIESKNSAAREIALALGVPPQLLGIPGDNTYSNLVEARIALWEGTVLPLVKDTIEHFNRWLPPYFADNLTLSYDTSCVSALAKSVETLWNMLENNNFMTINEKRGKVGLPPITYGDSLIAHKKKA